MATYIYSKLTERTKGIKENPMKVRNKKIKAHTKKLKK